MGGLGQDGAVCSSERVRCPPRARLNDMNSSRSDRPEQDHRDGIDGGNHGPTRPSEPRAARHSSGSSSAVPRRSAGAIAAVLFTVSGALALSLWFAYLISIQIVYLQPLPPPEYVTVKVSYFENEDINSGYKDPKGFRADVRRVSEGYLVVPVRRSDLCFDLIKKGAYWPPDLGTDAVDGEGGLVSYKIEIIYPDDQPDDPSRDASYIVQRDSSDEFILLVPHDRNAPAREMFDGMTVFKAVPQGVIDLAKKEKEKKAQR